MIDVSTRDSRRRFYLSSQWQNIRKEVLERDHYECQWCASEGRLTTQADSVLEVDHIKELEYYPVHRSPFSENDVKYFHGGYPHHSSSRNFLSFLVFPLN